MSISVATANPFDLLSDERPASKAAAPAKAVAPAAAAKPEGGAGASNNNNHAANNNGGRGGGNRGRGGERGRGGRGGGRGRGAGRGQRDGASFDNNNEGDNQSNRQERHKQPRQRREKDHHESGTGRPVNEGPKRAGAGRGNAGKPIDVDPRDKSVEETVHALEEGTEVPVTPQAATPEPVAEKDNTITLSEYLKKQAIAPETRSTVREVAAVPGMQRKDPVENGAHVASTDKPKHKKKDNSEKVVAVNDILDVKVPNPPSDDRNDRRRGPRDGSRQEGRGGRRPGAQSSQLQLDDKSFPALGAH